MSIELILLLLAVLIACLELLRRTIWKRYSERPEIEVRYYNGNSKSRAGRPGTLNCTWKGTIELQNNSDHDAMNLKACWKDKPDSLTVTLPDDHHLQRLTGAEIKLRISIDYQREAIENGTIPHPIKSQVVPEELRSFALLLEYQNRYGKCFYTLFVRRDCDEGASTCLRRRPEGQWTPISK